MDEMFMRGIFTSPTVSPSLSQHSESMKSWGVSDNEMRSADIFWWDLHCTPLAPCQSLDSCHHHLHRKHYQNHQYTHCMISSVLCMLSKWYLSLLWVALCSIDLEEHSDFEWVMWHWLSEDLNKWPALLDHAVCGYQMKYQDKMITNVFMFFQTEDMGGWDRSGATWHLRVHPYFAYLTFPPRLCWFVCWILRLSVSLLSGHQQVEKALRCIGDSLSLPVTI